MNNAQIHLTDCYQFMASMPDQSVEAIITDPMYDDTLDLAKFERVCKGPIIMFCKPENQFFKPDEFLFWIKTPSTKVYSRNCGRFVEMILVLRRGGAFNRLHWSQMTGVYDDRLIYPPVHPYEKPLTLMDRLVRIYTNPGDTIFDPFMGSGTTIVAAAQNGRKGLGCENNPEYFSIAQERLR